MIDIRASGFNSMSSNVHSHFLEKSLSECACTKLKPTCSNHSGHEIVIDMIMNIIFNPIFHSAPASTVALWPLQQHIGRLCREIA